MLVGLDEDDQVALDVLVVANVVLVWYPGVWKGLEFVNFSSKQSPKDVNNYTLYEKIA